MVVEYGHGFIRGSSSKLRALSLTSVPHRRIDHDQIASWEAHSDAAPGPHADHLATYGLNAYSQIAHQIYGSDRMAFATDFFKLKTDSIDCGITNPSGFVI